MTNFLQCFHLTWLRVSFGYSTFQWLFSRLISWSYYLIEKTPIFLTVEKTPICSVSTLLQLHVPNLFFGTQKYLFFSRQTSVTEARNLITLRKSPSSSFRNSWICSSYENSNKLLVNWRSICEYLHASITRALTILWTEYLDGLAFIESDEQYCLKWGHNSVRLISAFRSTEKNYISLVTEARRWRGIALAARGQPAATHRRSEHRVLGVQRHEFGVLCYKLRRGSWDEGGESDVRKETEYIAVACRRARTFGRQRRSELGQAPYSPRRRLRRDGCGGTGRDAGAGDEGAGKDLAVEDGGGRRSHRHRRRGRRRRYPSVLCGFVRGLCSVRVSLFSCYRCHAMLAVRSTIDGG